MNIESRLGDSSFINKELPSRGILTIADFQPGLDGKYQLYNLPAPQGVIDIPYGADYRLDGRSVIISHDGDIIAIKGLDQRLASQLPTSTIMTINPYAQKSKHVSDLFLEQDLKRNVDPGDMRFIGCLDLAEAVIAGANMAMLESGVRQNAKGHQVESELGAIPRLVGVSFDSDLDQKFIDTVLEGVIDVGHNGQSLTEIVESKRFARLTMRYPMESLRLNESLVEAGANDFYYAGMLVSKSILYTALNSGLVLNPGALHLQNFIGFGDTNPAFKIGSIKSNMVDFGDMASLTNLPLEVSEKLLFCMLFRLSLCVYPEKAETLDLHQLEKAAKFRYGLINGLFPDIKDLGSKLKELSNYLKKKFLKEGRTAVDDQTLSFYAELCLILIAVKKWSCTYAANKARELKKNKVLENFGLSKEIEKNTLEFTTMANSFMADTFNLYSNHGLLYLYETLIEYECVTESEL